jgi:hypothetical protein
MTEIATAYAELPQTAPTEEDVAKTIAEYETIAIGTGARCEFEAPSFSADGVTWTKAWLAEQPPVAAMARVRRDGAESEVVVLWRDVVPADEEWRKLWERRPSPLFGAYARRAVILHAFRDVFGERREPGDNPRTLAVEEPPKRDWDAELEAATSSEHLMLIWAEARNQRERTAPREVIYERRLAELEAAEADAWGAPGEAAAESRTSTGALRQTVADRTRGMPRDYLKPSSPKKRNRKRGRR